VNPPPATITITIVNSAGDYTVTRRQPVDRLGRPTATQTQLLKDATADARSWLRRNGNDRMSTL
jgi:hypothetical protein